MTAREILQFIDDGLSAVDIGLLAAVWERPEGISKTELSQFAHGVNETYISSRVKAMADDGLLRREFQTSPTRGIYYYPPTNQQ